MRTLARFRPGIGSWVSESSSSSAPASFDDAPEIGLAIGGREASRRETRDALLRASGSSPNSARPYNRTRSSFRSFSKRHLAPSNLNLAYTRSEPYKHCVIDALFNPELLFDVQSEIIGGLSFTEKETDIYKVHQTGDLASLSYLSPTQLSLFPSLLRLRDALYSSVFRNFLREVTGCGPLSGTKQDMSVNSYKNGCHLLNHDDVIGTRRVSYILYIPITGTSGQQSVPWDPSWGGALELYPVTSVEGTLEPNFVFFEVQPGHSFHSVEEVVVGTPDDGKERLSISGWFHAAQLGEEGHDPEGDEETWRQNSSLYQLSSSSSHVPILSYPGTTTSSFDELTTLSDDELADLTPFLNPTYLQPPALRLLASKFAAESSIELHSFLEDSLASSLLSSLPSVDEIDGFGPSRSNKVPPHHSGSSAGDWDVKGPPHKHRYCILSESSRPITSQSHTESVRILRDIQTMLLPSAGFRAWLRLISTFLPLGFAVEARRFRPGLDYTLARASDEIRLDVVLGLTPPHEKVGSGGTWEDGNWGGWECYMAPHQGEDDPAVYRSGSRKTVNISHGTLDGGEEENGDDDDEGTLLTVHAGFNKLLIVLRDEGVLHFVKYVSASASGSRWDVCAEYSIETLNGDDDAEEASAGDM
ncbi:hypothetical protein BS47DRAFT_1377768 [Hydnum rufescens UP504]|uniref:Fe2OG dioxygenase domain-containing protein n=1 Tax=Hydnum rufescens UP504 TaxID=1448309 RepID=A0A9P6DNN7_9AGAM|nr:hypothetical protein BS47DRAFT_1377768 [Hydnum rufescens UP504]